MRYPETYWRLTRIKTRASGRSGEAYGVLTWKGRDRGVEEKINGMIGRGTSSRRRRRRANANATLADAESAAGGGRERGGGGVVRARGDVCVFVVSSSFVV